MRRLALVLFAVALALGAAAFPRHLISRTAITNDFVHFESPHVHPAVLTPSRDRLLVVNTPDNRLSVFDLSGAQPVRVAEIPVGLEPVSVAAHDDSTAWVVNNLSDDVSIVDLTTMHVKATLRVGDEPSDVVFAGSPRRAYVSVSQEDLIRVYDPADLAAAPRDIPIDGRYPRSLATDASGSFVYAAVFFAGNRTSVLGFQEVPPDSQPQDTELPRDAQLTLAHGEAPRTGLIVQQQGGDWRDMYGKLWNHRIPYTQHDVDVAEIPAGAAGPSRTFDGLGAVNFAIAVSPSDGRIAVASTEARNLMRFEQRVRGHSVDTQLGLITAAGVKTIVSLNPHVNYAGAGTSAERDSALGIPTGLAFADDGQRVYVTSLASDKLGVIEPATGAILARASVIAGPTGVVVDDARGRVYVVGRFHNELQTLSTSDLSEVGRAGIGFDPTPDEIVNGRRFFYGGFTSAHGEQACASCHLFGDFDNLAWDLGDPTGAFQSAPPNMDDSFLEGFDPMKGPMATQSLRGLPNTGRLHWRADRENLAAFNRAFVDLMGRGSMLPDSEMAAFSDFVNALVYPPNPYERLDRTMPDAPPDRASAERGRIFFESRPVDNDHTCNFCHAPPTTTNRQVIHDDLILEDQDMKVPHLRNLYKKTGFSDAPGAVNKRGFGFTHDGSVDNLFNFLKRPNFEFDPGPSGDLSRRDVEAFLLAVDTGMAPAVGYQLTFDASNRSNAAQIARLDTLRGQSEAGNCDLIAKGRISGQSRGWRYSNDGTWKPDKQADAAITSAALRLLAGPAGEVTITGVPAGSGERIGVDRDRDGARDGDELDAGTDPGNPASKPAPRVNVAPRVDAGPDLAVTRPASASLNGSVSDDELPGPPHAVSQVWRKTSGPGTVTFGDSLAARTTASFSRSGSYQLRLNATDGALSGSDEVTVLVLLPGPCTSVLDRRVTSGADDAEEKSTSVSVTGSDLELVFDGAIQTVGLRFTNITIPQGALITSAYLQFMADEAQSEATTLRIQAQAADTTAAFTTAKSGISTRPKTNAFATWQPGAWTTVGAAGFAQRTTDLSAVIQEVVDRPNWKGRSLAFIITGTGHRTAESYEGTTTGAAKLHIEVSCAGANQAPAVHAGPDASVDLPATVSLSGAVVDDGLPGTPVTSAWRKLGGPGNVIFGDSLALQTTAAFSQAGAYSLGLVAYDGALYGRDTVRVDVRPAGGAATVIDRAIAAGSDDAEEKATSVSLTSSDLELINDGGIQTVGLRFASLQIPKGATIQTAYIKFAVDEAQSEATVLAIRAQDADNPPTFTTAKSNVSSRPRAADSVSWSPGPWTTSPANQVVNTPTLTQLVQAIVNRPLWASGNAIAFVITGTGHRTAVAFEGSKPPVLHVEFTTPAGSALRALQGAGVPITETRLAAVFPNPGRGEATIHFELARTGEVALEIYDLRGALVRRIVSGAREAGRHTESWDGRDQAGRRMANGVYLVRFAAAGHRDSRKLIVLR